jgi:hypothetical protein
MTLDTRDHLGARASGPQVRWTTGPHRGTHWRSITPDLHTHSPTPASGGRGVAGGTCQHSFTPDRMRARGPPLGYTVFVNRISTRLSKILRLPDGSDGEDSRGWFPTCPGWRADAISNSFHSRSQVNGDLDHHHHHECVYPVPRHIKPF